ncbi:MAG: trehalose-phosphatase [Microbacterium sp.]|uniref:trehalose-phosphatase n=1 Tax=Microbacterium sp. TaxID=51671 RepID=UPI0039E58345
MTASTPEQLEAALRRLAAAERLLVACDFDGTLSPLVDQPMAARMHPDARAAIEALTRLPDVAVAFVSGRTLADLRVIAEHADDSPVTLAGSHGAEYWFPGSGAAELDDDAADLALRDRLCADAEAGVRGVEGAWIEPKAFGLCVHTRLADPDGAATANALVDALVRAAAPHWRRRTGHDIVEYSFRYEGKDSAVAALRERVDATSVLFAGDDVTDEDALRSLGPGDIGVHVGDRPTAATVSVGGIPAFAAFLAELARRRADAQEIAPRE